MKRNKEVDEMKLLIDGLPNAVEVFTTSPYRKKIYLK